MRRRFQKFDSRPGITKIESAVLIVLVVITAALFIPSVERTSDMHMGRTQCINNLRQIGLGLHNFESTFKRLPPLYGGVVDKSDEASTKFANVWGSTQVFILTYIEHDILYSSMASGNPAQYVPSHASANAQVVTTYVCPMDPTMADGLIPGPLSGSSYVANAQVFAPLKDESIKGKGNMFPSSKTNYMDRGIALAEIKDGLSNTIGFMHSYALCGSKDRGTAWGYTAGLKQPPSTAPTFQPWARATYIGQSGMLAPGQRPFQIQPKPWDRPYDAQSGTGCDPLLPASPHNGAMLVLLMDASVRMLVPSISTDTWNKACLPMDGNEMPPDW